MNGNENRYPDYARKNSEGYFDDPNPYEDAPSCNVNLLELSRYARKSGKKLIDLTKEEVETFKI